MAYALRHRVPVEQDIRRVLRTQASKALDALDSLEDDPEGAVHQCRKRCKKVRGAIRLVRPAVVGDGYATVNGLARDAARQLAPFRDAAAMATTLERLRSWSGPVDGIEPAGTTLERHRVGARAALADDDAATARARSLLADLADAVDAIELDHDGFDAVGDGFATTYGRGRDALEQAMAAPTGEAFHEWRKRAEYTSYHVRLLAPSAPMILDPLDDAFHVLTDALGDAHDLVVLGGWLRSDADDVRELGDTTDLRIAVDGVRSELERTAVALGRRVHAEPPKRIHARLRSYWETWQAERHRAPAGGLEVLVD